MYVFISYSSKDSEDAYALKALCEANGIDVWMAPESIPTGKSYMTEIPPAIDSSRCFILLLTQESEASHYVQCEVDRAMSSIPLRVIPISKGYLPTGALRLPLEVMQIRQVHQIDGSDADLLDTLRLIKEKMLK